ncbi:MAG TPA: putative toxin-antitoxin system toxin component, PIN family [Burkholderiales bacterium]|nr:putative toxin-antitoxin system toxin component, PIN family [Burkholderiales bacterium]
MQRLVLDTNVWLDWLLFEDPGIARLRALRERGAVEILIDEPCEAELAEVLARPFAKRTLDAAAQAAALAACRRASTRVQARLSDPERARLPLCRDPDDQKFLELAAAAGADCLVTKDRELLALSRRKKAQVGRGVPFRILHPDEF